MNNLKKLSLLIHLKDIPSSYNIQSNDLVKEDTDTEIDAISVLDYVKTLNDDWKKKNKGEFFNSLINT